MTDVWNILLRKLSFSHSKRTIMLQYPCAKINIGLNVVCRRPDGYHDLETVFYPVPLTDVLELKPLKNSNEPYLLQTVGYGVEGTPEDNLVVKVYKGMAEEFGIPPLDIYLQKRIPMGAGLGGGSSDAAFMMKMLNEMFALGLDDEVMERRLSGYGADCAFFVKARPAYATGIGDRLSPIELSLKGLYLVMVKPSESVSTREAYSGITPAIPQNDLRESLKLPVREWRHLVVNDFEKTVFAAHPSIAAIKETLYDMGALYAAMSGSGSTVFGLFDRPIDNAREVFGNCFVFTTRL